MGQTLTHGVYLPDEGERNCYAGLAANWQLLDNSVGTIAEHTTALSNKAPLVHTHTKSDITDFPVLANVATSGSYNDLSNIPATFTPSSHTHGNLTNDGKIGTTANKPLITGTGGAVQAGSFGTAANTFCEGNDSRLSDARTPVAHTHVTADVTDLLSGDHTWSGIQTFGAKVISQTNNTEISGEDIYQCLKSDSKRAISFRVSNNSNYRTLLLGVHDTINSPPKGLVISNDNSNYISVYSDSPKDLGTATYKWKSLNGINPGALSLPKGGTTENVDYYNIATAIKPSGETSTNFSGTINYYQPTIDGWLSLVVTNCTDLSVWETIIKYGSITSGASRNRQVMVPVLANHTYEITIQGSAWYSARLMPCQGNV